MAIDSIWYNKYTLHTFITTLHLFQISNITITDNILNVIECVIADVINVNGDSAKCRVPIDKF